jgi:FkbM family methyltransferase
MTATFFVNFYRLVHGKLGMPGAGWLIRRMTRLVPRLRNYPLVIPGVGTTLLDFRDIAAFGLLNFVLKDFGTDAHLLERIESLFQPGDVFWDIGANVGYMSLYFAMNCPELGSIHAFEPNPAALKTLQPLFGRCARVVVHPVGLGDQDSEMEMQAVDGQSQCGSLARPIPGGKVTRVVVRAGDNYRREQGLPAPNVIKIDVEGFEPHVIAGLADTINSGRPAIVFEHIFLSDEQIRTLVPNGYSLVFILDDGRLSADFANRTQSCNAILLHSSDARLPAAG